MTTIADKNIEAIWVTFATRLRAFILKRVAHEAAADDILQDVFLKIHSHIDSLNDPARLESWIYNITRNAIADHFRSRRPVEELCDSLTAPPEPAEGDDQLDLTPAIRRLIGSLPEVYRRALVMTAYEGLTLKQVAERSGISLSGAKSRVQRAREKLKEMLLECCHLEFDRFGKVIECEPRRACCDCQDTMAGHRDEHPE
jgi:RNA polymerase sigma-70 factor (ECF subfamily)